jgi:hypothetical protein
MSTPIASSQRPRPTTADDDVLIVPAGKIAFDDYLRYHAYICQPERSFRDVERIGFYRKRQIEPFFPRIRYRRLNVDFSRESAAALRGSGAPLDAEVADVIDAVLDDRGNKYTPGAHQVFLLTAPDDPQTLTLAQPVVHPASGRGSAWVQNIRYTSEAALRENPRTTDELP